MHANLYTVKLGQAYRTDEGNWTGDIYLARLFGTWADAAWYASVVGGRVSGLVNGW